MFENRFEFKGRDALLLWGYHQAAVLGAWALTRTAGGVSFTATVLSSDAFKAQQQPLTVRVRRQNGVVWTWPVESLHMAGETLTATLGPQGD
jgi:hypothetical protein